MEILRRSELPSDLTWPPPVPVSAHQRHLSTEEQFLGSSRRNCDDGDGPPPVDRPTVNPDPRLTKKTRLNPTDTTAEDELFDDTIARMTIRPENFGIVTLNMDGALPGKSDYLNRTFRQLRLLNIQGVLMQDRRCTEVEFKHVLRSAATYLHDSDALPTYALSPAPISPNGMTYGGVAILLPPYMKRRVSHTVRDERELGRCALIITLDGRSDTALTLCSLYVTPAPGSENGVHATQARALGKADDGQDPTTTALYKDPAKHLTERRSKGNELLLGADFQTNMHIPELPASQKAWGSRPAY